MTQPCPVCGNALEEQAAACPFCGFKLLGTTQQFKPVALDDELLGASQAKITSAQLKVVRGPQTGIAFDLGQEPLTIGRSPKCGLFLNDMTVSREHAVIEVANGGYVIRDTNSFNGVWVNNANVEEHQLKSGDIIQIGAFCILYQES